MIRFLTAPVLCLAAAATLSCAAPALAQRAFGHRPERHGEIQRPGHRLAGRRPGVARAHRSRRRTACGGAPDIRQLDRLASFEACRRSAVARAVAAVDLPMLTALAHRGRPPASPPADPWPWSPCERRRATRARVAGGCAARHLADRPHRAPEVQRVRRPSLQGAGRRAPGTSASRRGRSCRCATTATGAGGRGPGAGGARSRRSSPAPKRCWRKAAMTAASPKPGSTAGEAAARPRDGGRSSVQGPGGRAPYSRGAVAPFDHDPVSSRQALHRRRLDL